MKKRLKKAIKDTSLSFVVILSVQFILSYTDHSKMFTDTFIVFLIAFLLSSFIFKFLLKDNDD